MSYKRAYICRILIYFLFSILVSLSSFAQRGSNYSIQNKSNREFKKNLPNFFDSEALEKNTYAFEVPTLSIDYGVSDNFTFGLNLLAPIVAYRELKSYSIAAKARYKILAIDDFSWAATVYPFFSLNQGKNYFRTYLITNNVSYKILNGLNIDFSFIASNISIKNLIFNDEIGDSRIESNSYWTFLSLSYLFQEKFNIEANIGAPIYNNSKIDSFDSNGYISSGISSMNKNILGRLLVHYNISDDRFISAGILYLGTINKITPLFFYTWKIQ